jgi:hypothetical protein
MSKLRSGAGLAVLVAALLSGAPGLAVRAAAQGPAVVVDAFEDLSPWTAMPASGVSLRLSADEGVRGRALRLDFDFGGGGGYAVAHRRLDLELPENYRLRFRVRGDCRPQNLEFKLIDASGENVWWQNRRDVAFPAAWDTFTIKKRQISFAWGPAGGGELRRAAAIEFAITAGSGGRGTVWIDELVLEPLPPPGATPPAPVASASSAAAGRAAALALSGGGWRAAAGDARPWFALDFTAPREFGGLVLEWEPGRALADYAVEASEDGAHWRTLREVRGGDGGRDFLYLPESEARHLRVAARAAAKTPPGLLRAEVQPLEWAASLETFFLAIAKEAPRGHYPRSMSGELAFWTIVGVDDAREEALIDEDGRIETGKRGWSIEPFVWTGGRLLTWADARSTPSLVGGHLPIPEVTRRWDGLELVVTAFADGPVDRPHLYARYVLRNTGTRRARGTLFLALRPFQVNPPSQFLNTPGGTATLRSLGREGRVVRVDDGGLVVSPEPASFGAATFDGGDVTAALREGRVPRAASVTDSFAHASGALGWPFELAAGASREVVVLVPMVGTPETSALPAGEEAATAHVAGRLAAVAAGWRERTDRVSITVPDSAADIIGSARAQIGWILVNRDRGGIQPGSRSYERSWIRDGSLTSSALLRMGLAGPVREFIEWFAPHQYADGKVPCCVDQRGADPVPEHDSHGQFIYLVAEYHRYTGDRALVERMWPAVLRAAEHLDTLRGQRRTPQWRAPEKAHFFGLLPPSISHEGYSAKPMHSYWDDLFALRGYKDAVYLARVLGRDGERARLERSLAEFGADLAASIQASMKVHGIDYVPGCADLGDFDATSTTIALDPVQAGAVVPRAALERTFERYWDFFTARRDGRQDWEAYTPYEMRTIGAFVWLGWRERAQEATRWFLGHRDPPGWRQWAEVVWKDRRATRFIGDLPHTWVGSDYVRSILDMLAYVRESDGALVLAAGVPGGWLAAPAGIEVRGLPTPRGTVGFALKAEGGAVVGRVEGAAGLAAGAPVLLMPPGGPFRAVEVRLGTVELRPDGALEVRSLPAEFTLRP